MTPGLPAWLKPAVFVVALLPLARLFILGQSGGLGANPVEFVTRSTGTWALVMLCVTLAVTPLRRLSGWNTVVRLRRMLGLFAFFYATLHFVIFLWLEHWFDVAAMLRDVFERPFVTAGFIAFALLVPLAATSTQAMIRRLGGARWRALHRLVYLAAPLAVLHFWWHKAGKNDFAEPTVYAIVVAVLLALRLPGLRRRK